MAITANTVPANPPSFVAPYDASLAFCSAATLTSTGYLGSPTTLDLGAGRQNGLWVTDVSALDVSSNDESYRFFLLGSNDATFANGNVDLLAMRDIAAVTAGRIIPTVLGASPSIPATGRAGTMIAVPFTTQGSTGIVFRYTRGYVVIGGTTPTVTITSWLTVDWMGGGRG